MGAQHPERPATSLSYSAPRVEAVAESLYQRSIANPVSEAAILVAAEKVLVARRRKSTAGFVRTDIKRLFNIVVPK